MNIINTRQHGLPDYLYALVPALPWITAYGENSPASSVLAAVAACVLIVSLFTDYEPGVLRFIPLKAHPAFGVMVGLFLIALPALVDLPGFKNAWPAALGVIAPVVALLTSSHAQFLRKKDRDIAHP